MLRGLEYMSIISNTESSYISILELGFFSGEEHDSISTDKMVVNKCFICKYLSTII